MTISMKAARVNKGLTQEEAAHKLGITKNTLLNYEKGRTAPDIDIFKRIVKLYGCTVDDIIFFKQ